MPKRIVNRLKFQVERLVLRGAHFRLLVIAATIGVVSLVAGLVVYRYAGGFQGPGDAIWWAFLRMTDPGYLGDDEGLLLRTVSTVLTVLGFVLFVGALIAIMTQWLNQSIRTLESGFTPVALRQHVVVLGWTNRTAAIVRELVLSEGRLRRFLRRHGARGLRIAILAEEVGPALRQELKDRLGPLWKERQTVLRTGSALRVEQLARVNYAEAAAILVPGSDFRLGQTAADTRVIKTLLSMGSRPAPDAGSLPLVVAEVFDARKIPIARAAYPGRIELLASDSIISRLIAQTVRHRGLSHVYAELLTYGRGNQIYVREATGVAGITMAELGERFAAAIPLGVARPHGASYSSILNPPGSFRVEEGDRLVVLARRYEDALPGAARSLVLPSTPPVVVVPPSITRTRRVLVLGWSHRAPALLREFDGHRGEAFTVDVLSAVPAADRVQAMERYDDDPCSITIRQMEGDYTAPVDLRRLDPGSYDNVILLGSDWLDSGEESDARTILGYLLLRGMLPESGGPEILVELLDPANVELFRRRADEVLISPVILSHMLAQVALRPELRAVFDELFGPGGGEVSFTPVREMGGASTFAEVRAAAAARGEIAIGLREPRAGRSDGGITLNPPPDRRVAGGEEDEVVVLISVA